MPYYIIFCKSAKEKQTVKSLRRIAKKNGIDISFRLQEKEMVNHSLKGRITKKYNYEMRGDDEYYCSQLFEFPQTIRKKNVFIKSGEVIIVTRGAFTSLKGKILKLDMKRERVDVEITLLGKTTKISLPVDHVEEAPDEANKEKQLE